jgi:hypothetical protein
MPSHFSRLKTKTAVRCATRDSCAVLLCSLSPQLTAHRSQIDHSSQLTAHSSQLTAHSSQLTAHSSQPHSSQLTAHSSQLAHSSQHFKPAAVQQCYRATESDARIITSHQKKVQEEPKETKQLKVETRIKLINTPLVEKRKCVSNLTKVL